jgi:hypothetical protein
MGPAVVVPLFWVGFGTTVTAIGSRAISSAVASNNYVRYYLDNVDRSDKVI